MSHYPKRGVQIRFVDGLRHVEIFLANYNDIYKTDVRFDPGKLYLVFKSAMDDVQRYKDYHFGRNATKLADAVKRAAFVTKWLLRFRPLWEPLDDFHGNLSGAAHRPAIIVNEEFAISLSLLYLSEHINEDIRISPAKLEVLYNFLYRDLSDDSFMLFYQLIIDAKTKRELFR